MEKVFDFILNSDLDDRKTRNQCLELIATWINMGLEEYNTFLPVECINTTILVDVIQHYRRDMQKFKDPNEFKLGGYLCFWIRKLKPFRKHEIFKLYTNEFIALSLGLNAVYAANIREPNKKKTIRALPSDVWSNLLYDLRYRPMSPNAVANHFHLLYV